MSVIGDAIESCRNWQGRRWKNAWDAHTVPRMAGVGIMACDGPVIRLHKDLVTSLMADRDGWLDSSRFRFPIAAPFQVPEERVRARWQSGEILKTANDVRAAVIQWPDNGTAKVAFVLDYKLAEGSGLVLLRGEGECVRVISVATFRVTGPASDPPTALFSVGVNASGEMSIPGVWHNTRELGAKLGSFRAKGETAFAADIHHEKSKDADHLVVFAALQLLGCRNVGLVDAVSHASKRKLSRGEPAVSYKELVLRPFASKATANSAFGEAGTTPLHMCRGHFRKYVEGESTGLFGRGLYGTFWVPSHLRGNHENGTVLKDYVISGATP